MSRAVKEHLARFGADPNGLSSAITLAKAEGYEVIQVIRSQGRHHDFKVIDPKQRIRFIKVTQMEGDVINLKNEVEAHRLAKDVFAKAGVRMTVPEGELYSSKGGVIADFEFIEATQIVNPNKLEEGFIHPLKRADLEDVFQAMLALHRVDWHDLPDFFRQRSRREFTLVKVSRKLWRDYLSPAVLNKVVAMREARALLDLHRNTFSGQRLVHHDLVPWNLLRRPDGSLMLVDGEFTRWGMKWYDVAYYVLQSRVMMGEVKHSRQAMRHFLKRFGEELPNDRITEEIFHPLAYWTGVLLFVSVTSPHCLERAQELVGPVLDRDLSFFI